MSVSIVPRPVKEGFVAVMEQKKQAMIRRYCLPFVTILMIVLLGGCGQRTGMTEDLRPVASEELLARLKSRLEYYRIYQVKFHLRADGPKGKLRLRGVMLAELPDRVRLEVFNPLGQTVGLLLLNGEKSSLWLPSERVAYTAAHAESLVRFFLGASIAPRTFAYSLIAAVPASQLKQFELSPSDGGWTTRSKDSVQGKDTLWSFTSQPMALKSFEMHDGSAQYTVSYDPPADLSLTETPKSIKFSSPEWQIEVNVDQLSKSSPAEDLAFQPSFPVETKRIDLDGLR